MDLEKRIEQIQRSTRTSIPYFIPTHNSLRMRFSWYYNWHLSAKSNLVHILILLLFTANAFIGVYDRYIPHSSAAAGTTQWGSSVVSAPGDSGFGEIAKDSAGNIYVAGYTRSSGEYNFGNGVTVSNTNSANPILVKYNPDGLAQWAVTVQSDLSSSSLYYGSIAIDSTGNIYLATSTGGLGVFDFGNGITASGTYQFGTALLVKYNSEGVAQWAKTASATQKSYFNGVAVDTSGNVYATGAIVGTVPHDFGNGVVIAANGTNNGVIVKYNPAGEVQWAKIAETASSASKFSKVGVDSSGGIFAVGYIYRTGQFDFGNGATVVGPYNGINAVVVKYNTDGQAQWARTATEAAQESEFLNIAIDNLGGIYAVGTITGSTPFSFGDEVSVTASCTDDNALIVRYDANGSAQWAKSTTAGINYSTFDSVATDNNGNIYAAGHIYGGNVFDFGDGTTVTGALGGDSDNAVLLRYTSDGTADWATTPRVASDWSDFYGITADDNGNVYATGEINGTLPFDFGDGVTITGASSYSAFLVKYNFPMPSSASCSDGIQNQDETGIDCGGSCPACEIGLPADTPITTPVIAPTPPTCSDGIKNQQETDKDCGGSCGVCPADPPAEPVCNDGLKNGLETDIDCGGPCGACSADPLNPTTCPIAGESQCAVEAETKYSQCLADAAGDAIKAGECAISSCQAESECIVSCGGSGADEKVDIHVLSPNGNENYLTGDTIDIRWNFSKGIQKVLLRSSAIKLSVSKDGGTTFQQEKLLLPSAPGAVGPNSYNTFDKYGREVAPSFAQLDEGYLQYRWLIPTDSGFVSNEVRVKLEPFGSCIPLTEDTSDSNFSIRLAATTPSKGCEGLCSFTDNIKQLALWIQSDVKGSSASSISLLIVAAIMAVIIVGLNFISNVASALKHSDIFSYFIKGLDKNMARGMIYEAMTGLPIPKARVILTDLSTGQSVVALSDKNGRFSAPVAPKNQYNVQIEKENFEIYRGQGSIKNFELKFSHNFHGGKVTTDEDVFFLDYNIPLLQLGIPKIAGKILFYQRVKNVLLFLNYFLILAGFAFSFYALQVSASTYNWSVFGLYVVLIGYLAIRYLFLSGKYYGQVVDENKKPIDLALIRAVDIKNDKLVSSVASDKNGKFGMSLANGEYKIFVQGTGMMQTSDIKIKVINSFNPVKLKISMKRLSD